MSFHTFCDPEVYFSANAFSALFKNSSQVLRPLSENIVFGNPLRPAKHAKNASVERSKQASELNALVAKQTNATA